MKKHVKKMIAPVIISILFLLYFVGYALMLFMVEDVPVLLKILGPIILLALAGVMIYVLVSRIREIRSGEEDDLSKY